jgi:hypothetical protein
MNNGTVASIAQANQELVVETTVLGMIMATSRTKITVPTVKMIYLVCCRCSGVETRRYR